MRLLLCLVLAFVATSCGPKVKPVLLQQLEQCVLDNEDQVERQNCVERFAREVNK